MNEGEKEYNIDYVKYITLVLVSARSAVRAFGAERRGGRGTIGSLQN